jgi:hypothetical protein
VKVQTTTATITNCKFVNSATAVFWDRNADTNTYLDGTEFISGGTGHAIELGTNCPTSITLTDVTFTGYGGTPGSNPTSSSGSTDAAIYNNSGKTITINITDGTTPAIRNGAGATTVVVAGTVTVTTHCYDVDTSANIQGVSVWLAVSSGTRFEQPCTISQAAGTATVVYGGGGDSHDLATGNVVLIEGANEDNYNGFHSITVTSATQFTYPVPSGTASPATGTITYTLVIINNALTNASGNASDTRTYSGTQPVYGFAMKGTSAPVYKAVPISGSVSATANTTIEIPMTSDA